MFACVGGMVGLLLTLFDFWRTLVLCLLHPCLLLQAKLQDVCFPPLVAIPLVSIGVVVLRSKGLKDATCMGWFGDNWDCSVGYPPEAMIM